MNTNFRTYQTLIRVLLFFVLVSIHISSPSPVYSQSALDLINSSRRILDHQFDRADRELSPALWMEEARRGITHTWAIWAEMAPDLIQDPHSMTIIRSWTEEELEKRFTRWLLERFFGTGIELRGSALFQEIRDTERNLLYHIGPDGNILYDPRTGDPLLIRPMEDGRDFNIDLEL